MKNILVLCTGNSCRSQMMHGYLQKLAGKKARVYSAGIETHGVNSNAIAVMKEDDVDISQHTSNHIDEYRDVDFDLVITVCDHARENCPWFPSDAQRFHHSFEDPASFKGKPEEVMAKFREVRDTIRNYSAHFVNKYL
ncbi:MAG TPA: protein tyrosine phosphatase [Cryomorphaceae bacterium]|nr:protein tyrosine phosphatase [Owenweeksia sp.]MBF99245.1 protein tyrosine phosphatase [Owenweeksia sp.]HAD97902.1 protein tyrosine phosphatase [Cryomorphaceae bacterium]HBF20701.1 protein tyrosine phosphatase [Cryomorphaceae bacterium]HCQ16677.1 protein tyrosine phosphatase [Cryomorphaceae bacterium]|tara:strand:- start:122 stop:535 length:414 start_codon:yes stop_codon:yes gene_type:complete